MPKKKIEKREAKPEWTKEDTEKSAALVEFLNDCMFSALSGKDIMSFFNAVVFISKCSVENKQVEDEHASTKYENVYRILKIAQFDASVEKKYKTFIESLNWIHSKRSKEK